MDARVDGPAFPAGAQRLLAATVACGLVAMAAWYVVAGGLRGGLVHHDAAPPAAAGFTVNVNAAPATELAQLPGLGPATAERIVAHRRAHGPFTSLDGLLDVPGIGPTTLERMRPHLRPIRPPREPIATEER
jgi:competence ComEA-like helix-hairpin-helix protein